MRKLIIYIFLLAGSKFAFAQSNVNYRIIMRNTGTDTMWDGKSMPVYGFSETLKENPPVPGHILYANEGDTLLIDALNISQGDPHTIHPHGMDVNQENDGTPMTSFTIKHMKEYVYKIPCTHAGTYIYHCHMADVVHVQMGMYGLVIVRPRDGSKSAWTGGPAFQKEYSILTSEFDKSWHDSVPMSMDSTMTDTMAREDFIIPDYKPDYFLVNGKSKSQILKDSTLHIKGSANDHIFLRLANIGYYVNEYVFPSNLKAVCLESDGRPLPSSFNCDTLRIAPGERYGVMLHPQTEFTDSIPVRYVNMNTRVAEDVEYLPVSIKGIAGINHEDLEESISIYPNPAHDELFLSMGNVAKGLLNIALTNTLGQEEKSWLNLNANQNITLALPENLGKGVYFIRIQNGQNTLVKKVIVQ